MAALGTFRLRGEHVGKIAADVALVHEPSQSSGARQHREQRDLRQRNRRRTVVHEQDLIARERELVTTACSCSVDRGEDGLAAAVRHLLDAVARFVRELAEANFVGMRGRREHLDVGPGAEHLVEAAGDDDALDGRMLEPQPLQRVVQFDVYCQVVGVELQLVVVAEAAGGVDGQGQSRDRSVDVESPMAVARRIGVEVDAVITHADDTTWRRGGTSCRHGCAAWRIRCCGRSRAAGSRRDRPELGRAVSAAPDCRPDGPPVELTGAITTADRSTYRELPVAVASGTTRIEVGYSWTSNGPETDFEKTVVDLGLWDEDGPHATAGFRGWSGSRQGKVAEGQAPIFVQADSAERGYVPGPINAGTWYVELGFGAVHDAWRDVARDGEVSRGPDRPWCGNPIPSTRPTSPRNEPSWYRADLHLHAYPTRTQRDRTPRR